MYQRGKTVAGLTTIEEAARSAELVFRKNGWTYGDSTGSYADWEEIEETIRRLVFYPGFRDEEDPTDSISSGRILVTRDDLGSSEESRSVYLRLLDI